MLWLGYCRRCTGAVFLESVGAKETRAEIACVHCGMRKFVDYGLVKLIIAFHKRRANANV